MRLGLVASAWLFCAASAFAQAPATSPAAKAIAKGQEAVKLFEEGRYEEALPRFQQAEALYHSPVFLLYTARSLRETKRWVEAMSVLRRVATEEMESGVPAPWRQAKVDAKRELDVLLAEVPTVVVDVEGRSVATQATIDGNAAALGELIDVDPGPHTFLAHDQRGDSLPTMLTLAAGAKGLRVVIAFPPQAPIRPATAPDPPPATKLYRPGLWVLGAGATAIAAGSVLGVLALTRDASLPESCRGTICPEARRADVDRAIEPSLRLAHVADVLFIAGGLAALAGAYLVLSRGTVRVSDASVTTSKASRSAAP